MTRHEFKDFEPSYFPVHPDLKKEGEEEEEENVDPEKVDTEVPEVIFEDVNDLPGLEDSPLRRKSEKIKFPLSFDDKVDLTKLAMRFDNLKYVAGLALPQLGINKRAFAFEVCPGDEAEQTFPKSIWINPYYQNAKGAVLDEDYEACHSVKKSGTVAIGPVFRFNHILYRAYDTEGRILEGEAKGFAARVIQHQVDHLDGKVYTDFVQPERVLPFREYVKRAESKTLDEMQSGIVPEPYDG